MLFIIGPTATSGPLDSYFECEPVIIIEYNESILQDPVIPYETATRIPIEIKARIKGPGDEIVSDYLFNSGAFLPVKLFIEEVPEGCHASINPPLLELKPIYKEFSTIHANVSLTVDKRLPALQQEHIIIRVETARLGYKAAILKRGNVTLEMPFFIGFYPQVSIFTPEGNVKEIHPDETAEFPIELQNFGNGNTEINSEIIDLPEGWVAEIISGIVLGSENVGGNPKETIILKVRPPISFGYHEERKIIQVALTPSYYKNSEYAGEPHYLFFVVQSRGFSTPGFDFITLLFAFSLISFFIFRKKQSKRRGL
ncbi:MAG: hypothetical protein KAW45_05345 [Thermoplasmatales archaeon]|nr:hypothetical protein [Thermoplasmatales archaeon]